MTFFCKLHNKLYLYLISNNDFYRRLFAIDKYKYLSNILLASYLIQDTPIIRLYHNETKLTRAFM